jgi:hypothetical protein
MYMLSMIVTITSILLFIHLFLILFIFLLFILHVFIALMLLVDLGLYQLPLNLIFLIFHAQRLNNLHLLLLLMEEGVLELELFEPLFGLLLDLVLDTVDVKFLLV